MGGVNEAGVETQWYLNTHVISRPKGTAGLNAPKLLQLKATNNAQFCYRHNIRTHQLLRSISRIGLRPFHWPRRPLG